MNLENHAMDLDKTEVLQNVPVLSARNLDSYLRTYTNPILASEKAVERFLKRLRNKNIVHRVSYSMGGYSRSFTVDIGSRQIYFWTYPEKG